MANIRRQVRKFSEFCEQVGAVPVPASLDTILIYIQALAGEFSSVDTVANYLQGVKTWHLIEGFDIHPFNHFLVKLLLRGCRRQAQHKPRQALPITPDLLIQMHERVDHNSAEGATVWCLFLFAFFLVSRKSNLVPDRAKDFDPKKQLTRSNIKMRDDALLVTLEWTKTIQYGERKLVIPILAIEGSRLCPVSAYREMCRLMPASENEAAFLRVNKKGNREPVTYYHFQKALKEIMEGLGKDPAKFSTHSFRRGGATFAYEAGVPAETVKLMGDWRSECFRMYLQVSMACKTQAAEMIVKHIRDTEQVA